MKLYGRPKTKNRSENGIALFMVISAISVLSILLSELTYSTQVTSRLAFNHVDNLKAYYLTKAAYRLALVRLSAYLQVKKFIDDPSHSMLKGVLNKAIVDKIWGLPFLFPPSLPKEAGITQTNSISKFIKDSSLKGAFVMNIESEGSRLNLNNMFIKEVPDDQSGSGSSQKKLEVNFRQFLEPVIGNLLENRKKDDREFADAYRNVQARDLVDAIWSYVSIDSTGSNLPGFKSLKPKAAPFYSLSELHFIPGLDDELYNLIAPALTVYSTPGVNVNSISKDTLRALIPELTEDDATQLVTARDSGPNPKPWDDPKDFWTSIGNTSAGKLVTDIQARFKKGNVNIITSEESFKVGITATVGQATRKLEAYMILNPKALTATSGQSQSGSAQPKPPQGVPPGVQVAGAQNPSQGKALTALNLVYWRML